MISDPEHILSVVMKKRVSKIALFDLGIVSEVDTWMFDLEHISENEVNEAKLSLNLEELQRAELFVFDQHRRHFIVRRALLKIVLSHYVNIAPKAVQIAYGQYKKPYLENNGHIYFNFSHTDAKGILAVTKRGQIGIDIEHIKPIKDKIEILKQISSVGEQVWVGKSLERFLILWTVKEALIKCQGTGFLIDKAPLLNSPPVRINKNFFIAQYQSFSIYSIFTIGYRISLCFEAA
ncbi:MAG: 4'-phosphopantetheinyl transferase superfamily protein [Alphaproteobacteria bacterium]|nr:4'-phosphopantetheinyl transferase superfamily protein [Alphaproteobacteria bacterium]